MRYLCVAALLALASGASGDLLWDNGPFDEGYAIGNGKGVGTYFGKVWLEAADDFEVAEPGWIADGGYFEGLCFFGNLQVDSIIVAFYEDGGDTLPVEDPFYYEESIDFAETDYYDADWGYYRVEIDVGYGPVVLEPGAYWLQMTPVGLWGDWFYQGCTTQDWRYSVATREGGPWCGKGWDPYDWMHYAPGYDINFNIEGQIVPEPGIVSIAGLLVGLGAVVIGRK